MYYMTSELYAGLIRICRIPKFIRQNFRKEHLLNFNTNMPIYVQVIDEIKRGIIRGTLELGEKLPSARDLALQYQINPNTANRIYREMEMAELCFTKRGLGTFVTEDSEKVQKIKQEMAENLLYSFIVGMKELGYTMEEVIELLSKEYEAT